MQILGETARDGRIRLRTESVDDLWELSHLIDKNDSVTMRTERKVAVGGNADKQVRKPMTLTIIVMRVTFEEDVLRVQGEITAGPEDLISYGDSHTMDIRVGTQFDLVATFDAARKERFKKAVAAKPFNVLLVVFDREHAYLAELTRRGYSILQELRGNVSKKAPGGGSENFWHTVAFAVQALDERHNYQSILIASPAFWNDYLLEALPAELQKKTRTATCSAVGEQAVAEVARRPEVSSVLADHQASQETVLVDDVLEAVHTDKACYGVADCTEQANVGRVETLVVTQQAIATAREQETYEALDAVLQAVKQAKGTVHILEHDVQRIDALGGIAGVLRW